MMGNPKDISSFFGKTHLKSQVLRWFQLKPTPPTVTIVTKPSSCPLSHSQQSCIIAFKGKGAWQAKTVKVWLLGLRTPTAQHMQKYIRQKSYTKQWPPEGFYTQVGSDWARGWMLPLQISPPKKMSPYWRDVTFFDWFDTRIRMPLKEPKQHVKNWKVKNTSKM